MLPARAAPVWAAPRNLFGAQPPLSMSIRKQNSDELSVAPVSGKNVLESDISERVAVTTDTEKLVTRMMEVLTIL